MSLQFITQEIKMTKYFIISTADEKMWVYDSAYKVCVFFLGRDVLDYVVVKSDELSRKVNLEELEYFEFNRVQQFLEQA